MEDGVDTDDLFGGDGLLRRLKKRMAERILEAELTDHLGYEKHALEGRNRGNSRNGKTTKMLKDETGDLPVDIPRDREGSFDPMLIRKYQTRRLNFKDKIISMYARGMSTRDIQSHVEDLFGWPSRLNWSPGSPQPRDNMSACLGPLQGGSANEVAVSSHCHSRHHCLHPA